MQSISFETGCNYPPHIHYQITLRGLDSPTKAGGLAFRLHHPAWHILPLCLHDVKGRRLSPLTSLGLTAICAQRDGSSGSRRATGLENEVGYHQAIKIGFRKKDQLNFLQYQTLEEIDEANHEFESPS
jgi:hypothetical protein